MTLYQLPLRCCRVPLAVTYRLAGRSMRFINIQNSDCSEVQEATSHKHSKQFSRTRYMPLRKYYDVGVSELASLTNYHLPKLKDVEKNTLSELVSMFKARGYEWEEIKSEKEVLLLLPSEVSERISFLNDLGVSHPRLHDILHIQAIAKSKLSLLVEAKYIDKDHDVVEKLLTNTVRLNFPEELKLKIKNVLQGDGFTMGEIHIYILMHYMAQRFDVSVDKVRELFTVHRMYSWKSLALYPHIFDVLKDIMKLDLYDIMAYPILLRIDSNNVLKILGKYPTIGGMDVSKFAKDSPKLLLIPYHNISKWMNLFEEYKVRTFKPTSRMISLLSSNSYKKVEKALKVLEKLPEYEILQLSERFAELLQSPHAMKKILDSYDSGEPIRRVSSAFNSNKTVISHRTVPQEVKSYLAQELGIDENEESINDVTMKLGLGNIKLVLQNLLEFGFTRDQVLNGIEILNFEHTFVEAALKEFPLLPEVQPFDMWMKNPNVIHLLAYCINKNDPNVW